MDHTIKGPCSFIVHHYLAESDRTGSSSTPNYSSIAAFGLCLVLIVLFSSSQFDLVVLRSGPGSYPLISHVLISFIFIGQASEEFTIRTDNIPKPFSGFDGK